MPTTIGSVALPLVWSATDATDPFLYRFSAPGCSFGLVDRATQAEQMQVVLSDGGSIVFARQDSSTGIVPVLSPGGDTLTTSFTAGGILYTIAHQLAQQADGKVYIKYTTTIASRPAATSLKWDVRATGGRNKDGTTRPLPTLTRLPDGSYTIANGAGIVEYTQPAPTGVDKNGAAFNLTHAVNANVLTYAVANWPTKNNFPATIDPTTIASIASYSNLSGCGYQTHILYGANSGKWWAFTLSGASTLASYYFDGSAWQASTTKTLTNQAVTSGDGAGSALSLAYKSIGGYDVVHFSISENTASNSHYHLRATLGSTTVTYGSDTIVGTASGYGQGVAHGCAVAINANDKIVDASTYAKDGSNNYGNVMASRFPNADTGSAWTQGSATIGNIFTCSFMGVGHWVESLGSGDNVIVIGQNASNADNTWRNLRYSIWNGTSWAASAEVLAAAFGSDQVVNTYGAKVLDSTHVLVVWRNGATNIQRRIGTISGQTVTWNTAAALPTSGLTQPATSSGYAFYTDGTSTVWLFVVDSAAGNHIKYLKGTKGADWSSITWDASWTDWVTSSATRTHVGVSQQKDGSNNIRVIWTEGSGSPYSLMSETFSVATSQTYTKTATPVTAAVRATVSRSATPVTAAIKATVSHSATPVTSAVLQPGITRTATPVTAAVQQTGITRTATPLTAAVRATVSHSATPVTAAVLQPGVTHTATPVTAALQQTGLTRTATPVTATVASVGTRTATPVTASVSQSLTAGAITTDSTTVATADQLANSNSSVTYTVVTNKIARLQGWDQLWSQGDVNNWAALGAIGSPDGHGWLYESTSLETKRLLAGTYTPVLYLSRSSTTGTLYGTPVMRLYKRSSGGSYTLIATFTASEMLLTTTYTAASGWTGTTTTDPTDFASGDKLYLDIWLNARIVVNPSTSETIRFQSSSTSAGSSQIHALTPGYVQGVTTVQRTATPVTAALQATATHSATPVTSAVLQPGVTHTATPVTASIVTVSTHSATPVTASVAQTLTHTATPVTVAVQASVTRTATPVTSAVQASVSHTATPVTAAVGATILHTATPLSAAVQATVPHTATPLTASVSGAIVRTATPVTAAVRATVTHTATPVTAAVQATGVTRTATPITASVALVSTHTATPVTTAVQQTGLTRTATPVSAAVRATSTHTATPVTASVRSERTATPVTAAVRATVLHTATPITAAVSGGSFHTATPVTAAVKAFGVSHTATPVSTAVVQTGLTRTASPVTASLVQVGLHTATPVTASLVRVVTHTATPVTASVRSERTATPVTAAVSGSSFRSATPVSAAVKAFGVLHTASPVTASVSSAGMHFATPITAAVRATIPHTATPITAAVLEDAGFVVAVLDGPSATAGTVAGPSAIDGNVAGPSADVKELDSPSATASVTHLDPI